MTSTTEPTGELANPTSDDDESRLVLSKGGRLVSREQIRLATEIQRKLSKEAARRPGFLRRLFS